MTDEFIGWWKETGQYECCMQDNSPEEYKRILWAAWEQGKRSSLRWAAAQIIIDGNPAIAREKIERGIYT